MPSERHRARRYPFVASVELTDVQSETRLTAQTSDLSLFGCHVKTTDTFPMNTKLRLRIVHSGTTFEALGRVAYTQQQKGMGVLFTRIEPNNQVILDKWIAQLRGI